MKRITITDEGILISVDEMNRFSSDIQRNIRTHYLMLRRVGRITHKEHSELNNYLDKLLYPITEK